MHMASQLRVVRENRVVADLAVVREVHIGHDPVVIAQTRHAYVAGRTDIEGAKLAYGVALANHQLTGFAGVFFVLRNRTQGVELEYAVIPANRGVPLNHAMRAHRRTRTDAHMRANHGVGPNRHRAVELGQRINQGGGMYQAHGHAQAEATTGRTAQVSSACTARTPSTEALPLNLKMPAFMRTISTSRISWSPGSTGRLKRALSIPAK